MSNSSKSQNTESIRLANGDIINYERACLFIEFYVILHDLEKPNVITTELPHKPGKTFSVMMIGHHRIANAWGRSSLSAKRVCYLKAASNLEMFDPELWRLFTGFESSSDSQSKSYGAKKPVNATSTTTTATTTTYILAHGKTINIAGTVRR